MNTYAKYCPNVFLAKCTEQHAKGDTVVLTTKRSKENEVIIFNEIMQKDGFFYYSFVRADGWDSQAYAKAKADKIMGWAASAENKSTQYYQASNEWADFLRLAEPIKIGHHSEKRHRALIERNANRMDKAVELSYKAKDYEERAKYWEAKKEKIDHSMPESLEYFANKLEEAKRIHADLKANPEKRSHGYSLTCAKKDVANMEKAFALAEKLWA